MLYQPSLFDPHIPDIPDRIGPAKVSVSDTLHLLTPGRGRSAWFDYSLNPYRGCSFGCSYCFATYFVDDDEKRANWGKWVEVKIRAVEALNKCDLRNKKIFMSSVTDPYQPLEAKLCLTRDVVGVLYEQQARLVVQTRSPLAARDADLFKKFNRIRVNMSITTDDDSIRKRYEPGCSSVERRLEAVAKLKAEGICVAVNVCPMLPMRDPEEFGRLLTKMGVDRVHASFFHSSTKLFAAGTRAWAWELAQAEGWNEERFEIAHTALLRTCPRDTGAEAAFGPE